VCRCLRYVHEDVLDPRVSSDNWKDSTFELDFLERRVSP
jgi:hypothetical protein